MSLVTERVLPRQAQEGMGEQIVPVVTATLL